MKIHEHIRKCMNKLVFVEFTVISLCPNLYFQCLDLFLNAFFVLGVGETGMAGGPCWAGLVRIAFTGAALQKDSPPTDSRTSGPRARKNRNNHYMRP